MVWNRERKENVNNISRQIPRGTSWCNLFMIIDTHHIIIIIIIINPYLTRKVNPDVDLDLTRKVNPDLTCKVNPDLTR